VALAASPARRLAGAVPVPLLAVAVVGLGVILGWRGVDLPAQLYRIASFRAHGLTLWDSQWFGGQWALSYSVLFPPVAALAGVAVVTLASAAVSALAFDRLAVGYLGAGGRPAAVVFAVGTAVQSAIGQLPFLAGEALALAACWAVSRNRWATAVALALAASLTSPLAGLFLCLGLTAWVLSRWAALASDGVRWRAGAVMVAAAGPLCASAVLFPGQGRMPYPLPDYLWEVVVAAGLWAIAGPRHRTIRTGAGLFVAVATAGVLVPSALGGNVGRLEDVLALPLAVGVIWPLAGSLRRVVLPLVGVPLVLSQWGPAWGAMTADARQPSTHPAYFAPLVAALTRAAAGGPAGRVEVVPTEFHWEAAYVAPVMPLARGWERQTDEADNPLFYGDAGRLDASTYRSWLLDNGVRFVALADAPLDFAGVAEGQLLRRGATVTQSAGLQLVWHSARWQLYRVLGSAGLVTPPARLLHQDGGRVVVSTPAAGPVLVRVRYNPDWELAQGAGCVSPAPTPPGGSRAGTGTWIRVLAPAPERFTLHLSLLPAHDHCPAVQPH
jgi:hypothetical protein